MGSVTSRISLACGQCMVLPGASCYQLSVSHERCTDSAMQDPFQSIRINPTTNPIFIPPPQINWGKNSGPLTQKRPDLLRTPFDTQFHGHCFRFSFCGLPSPPSSRPTLVMLCGKRRNVAILIYLFSISRHAPLVPRDPNSSHGTH